MIKVEAVVIRERVETVIDAVEAEAGHVGVTVLEAVGHGRQRGITHEYRGRVFESRFLPKALLVFVVEDARAEAVVEAIADAARSGNPAGTASSGPPRSRTSRTTERVRAWRRWRRDEDSRPADRCEHRLGRRRGDPRDVHAGGLRLPRGRPHPDEERRPHRGQERPHLRDLLARLLGGRLRPCLRRRERDRRHVGLLPEFRRPPGDRRGAVQLLRLDPGGRRLPLRSRLRRRLARDRLGRHGRAREALGVLRLRRRLHPHLLRRLALDLARRRLALRPRHAGLRRLDGRPLPGRARRARRRAPPRAANRQVRHRRQGEPDPGPQHALRRPRHDHPLVRLVRLQPGLDPRRGHRRQDRLLRLRRPDDEPRRRGGRARRASSPPGSCSRSRTSR